MRRAGQTGEVLKGFRTVVERRSGVGRLFHGGQMVRAWAKYEIVVFQDFEKGVPSLRRLKGRIATENILELMRPEFESLTLYLADGDRLDFLFGSSDGEILNRGQGMYPPESR
jgi:hypothetical protein